MYTVPRTIPSELGNNAFKAMEEGPPRAVTDTAHKPLAGAVPRKRHSAERARKGGTIPVR